MTSKSVSIGISVAALVVIVAAIFLRDRADSPPIIDREGAVVFTMPTRESTPELESAKSGGKNSVLGLPAASVVTPLALPAGAASADSSRPRVIVPPHHIARGYTVDEDGIAVTDGDIAIGLAPEGHTDGVAAMPELQTWPTREIPYAIPDDFPNPERIHEALQMFSDTAVRFVPYNGRQSDVLVFQNAEGTCKSYVGRTGGKQPVFLNEKCGAHEIAHELMHALGFIHEQNRSDRDAFVKVITDSIDEKYKINFEKMPPSFMTLSGLSAFSFDSIMIYPPTLFSRNAQATIVPLVDGQRIAPSNALNDRDKARVNAYYGAR